MTNYLFRMFVPLQLVTSYAIVHLSDENYSPVRPRDQAPEKRIVTKKFFVIAQLYSGAPPIDAIHCFVSLNGPEHHCDGSANEKNKRRERQRMEIMQITLVFMLIFLKQKLCKFYRVCFYAML